MDSEGPSRLSRWQMLRVPVGGTLRVELLSGDWIRLATHFAGRTFLCADHAGCPACELLPARSFWYLPVVEHISRRPYILELSSHASADLEQVAKFAFGAILPGSIFDLSRRGQRKPVRAEAVEMGKAATTVQLEHWASCLMAIYNLPPFVVGETLEAYGERVRGRVDQRAEFAISSLKASKVR